MPFCPSADGIAVSTVFIEVSVDCSGSSLARTLSRAAASECVPGSVPCTASSEARAAPISAMASSTVVETVLSAVKLTLPPRKTAAEPADLPVAAP